MKKEIWISSHITREEGLTYLKSCISSIDSDTTIVISYSGLMITLPKEIIAYSHSKQLSQFQHIDYIFNMRSSLLDNNDVILFLDDDDMLLSHSDILYDGTRFIIEKFGSSMVEKGLCGINYTFSSPFDQIVSDNSISGLIGLQILGNENITLDGIHEYCGGNR